MREVIAGLNAFIRAIPFKRGVLIVMVTALLVFGNFHFGWEKIITRLPVILRVAGWYAIFAVAFWSAYFILLLQRRLAGSNHKIFRWLLLLAPLIFSFKLALPLTWPDNEYAQVVLYYPFKLLLTTALLLACWWRWHRDQPFYGTGGKKTALKPYALMLLAMVPLVALASMQTDFLHIYPKWQHYEAVRNSGTVKQLAYELSYGSDFITIELFFRGFLVLAFARYVGKEAILPMAVFYCTIHFGKPLGECISSFFGGILLGVVTYQTRSTWGGLLVHLGIAWLMELGGSIGHQLRPDMFY
jgi:hypothetical protein